VRISYVSSICTVNDAISDAVRTEIGWLRQRPADDVKLYCYKCDYDELPVKTVNAIKDIAFDEHFQESQLIVFHFGIYYPLFDLLPAAPKGAKRLVVFHNVTPKNLVATENQDTIERSFRQMSNIAFADYVACVSETNLETLRAHGVETPAGIAPLAIHDGLYAPVRKPSADDGVSRIVFVGRFVKAKGPTDLLRALPLVIAVNRVARFEVDLIGNVSFSNSSVLEEIRRLGAQMSEAFKGRIKVTIRGDASTEEKHRVLREADVLVLPTYHEGFCVPILEALASGCRVIAYDNSNTPAIGGGFAFLTPTGDIDSLAEAIGRETRDVLTALWRDGPCSGYSQFVQKTRNYVGQFSPDRTRDRFLSMIRLSAGQ